MIFKYLLPNDARTILEKRNRRLKVGYDVLCFSQVCQSFRGKSNHCLVTNSLVEFKDSYSLERWQALWPKDLNKIKRLGLWQESMYVVPHIAYNLTNVRELNLVVNWRKDTDFKQFVSDEFLELEEAFFPASTLPALRSLEISRKVLPAFHNSVIMACHDCNTTVVLYPADAACPTISSDLSGGMYGWLLKGPTWTQINQRIEQLITFMYESPFFSKTACFGYRSIDEFVIEELGEL